MAKDGRKFVKILRHYRMYVPGDEGMFPAKEADTMVSKGYGKIVGDEGDEHNPNDPRVRDSEGRRFRQHENVVQVENREIGVNTEDPAKKRHFRADNDQPQPDDEETDKGVETGEDADKGKDADAEESKRPRRTNYSNRMLDSDKGSRRK